MVNVTKEQIVRAVVIDIQNPYSAQVVDEVITTTDDLNRALIAYMDLSKYRIITV